MWFKFITDDDKDLRLNMHRMEAIQPAPDGKHTLIECGDIAYLVRQQIKDIDRAFQEPQHPMRVNPGW